MRYSTLFFDLDDTLYDGRTRLWDTIRDRMNAYMAERLQIPEENVSALRQQYSETYGTTLRGLQIHHEVDADDFLAYVHDLPLQDFLAPDGELRSLLLSLPQKRWVLTNSDGAHARRVLNALGLEGCFHGIADIRALDFACKPQPEAFLRAMELAGESAPERCVFLDDSPRNLAGARSLGLYTVLIGRADPDPSASLALPTLLALAEGMPELWENPFRAGNPG